VDADFIGPLLQAQKKAFAVRRFLEGKGIIDEFVATWPELKHKIKSEDMLERVLEEIGFDQSSVQSKEEFAEIMDAIAAEERQKQQLEAGSIIGGAGPKMGKAIQADKPHGPGGGGLFRGFVFPRAYRGACRVQGGKKGF